MRISDWSSDVCSSDLRFAPSLEGIRLAAERTRLLDMTILRASADVVAKSTVAIVAEQVLEAHGLIEAIGQADSHTQGLGLFAQLLSLMRVLFDGVQANTLKERSQERGAGTKCVRQCK